MVSGPIYRAQEVEPGEPGPRHRGANESPATRARFKEVFARPPEKASR